MDHKKQEDYVATLFLELEIFNRSLYWLKRSFNICYKIGIKESYEMEELDAIEAFTARFARSSYILIHKIFRSIDKIEFEKEDLMLDILNRTEKRGIIDSIENIRPIYDLNNIIYINYSPDDLIMLFKKVLTQSKPLLEIADRVNTYCEKYNHTTT